MSERHDAGREQDLPAKDDEAPLGFLNKLRGWSEHLDDALRIWDFNLSRTHGGRLHRLAHIDRHTAAALLLPVVLIFLLLLASPDWSARATKAVIWSIAIGLAIWVLMWLSARQRWSLKVDVCAQALIVLAVAGYLAMSSSSEYDSDSPYFHFFVPIAATLAGVLLLAAAIINPLFAYLVGKSGYGGYLKKTELFLSRGGAPQITVGTVLTALLTVPFRAPLVLLTPPALAALFAPPVWAIHAPVIAFGLCLALLFFAGLNERFGAVWLRAQNAFVSGGALLVTLAIIVLAVLRLAGVSYATTILDAAGWWIIAAWLVSAYVLSWWYDYWTHRLIADKVLMLLGADVTGTASIPYAIDDQAKRTSVPPWDRLLQVHGASRYVVIQGGPDVAYFQSHTLQELIERLATTGAPGGKATPTPAQIIGRAANFHVILVAALVGTLAAAGFHLNRGQQLPEAITGKAMSQKPVADFLSAGAADGIGASGDNPVIVLAASGGGTRAAVYTAAVLEGLERMGKGKNVLVASGVSGGGAALAYFAGHRSQLVGGSEAAWGDYLSKMSEPYIEDVLQRASEWRMVSRGRLGILLSESFERRWKLSDKRDSLGEVQDMGLIFNTSLAGHLHLPAPVAGPTELYEVEPDHRDALTKSTLAGGRLLLTNLLLPKELFGEPLEPDVAKKAPAPAGAASAADDVNRLPVVVSDPGLKLNVAAALNANFPPVFSNAAIDVKKQTRYWVTDGGAVDNRGIEMMLYTLRHALKDMPGEQLPHLRIVVADASAFDEKYSQDRGLSTMSGAGTRFASHLNAELYVALKQLYRATPERLQISYLMMPLRWRESGSFGTHWMLQFKVRVRVGDKDDRVVITGEDMVRVIRATHSGRAAFSLGPEACRVLTDTPNDDAHRDSWQKLVSSLKGTLPAGECPATGASNPKGKPEGPGGSSK